MSTSPLALTPALSPLHAAIRAGSPRALPVMFTLRAGVDPQPEQRPPLNLAVVIDASPSMSGAPLAKAKEAAIALVQRLRPDDRLAVIGYASSVVLLTPSTPVQVNREQAIAAIGRLEVLGGGTNLHAGWLRAAEAIAPHVHAKSLTRVMLLSDGNANVGITHTPEIVKQCEQLMANGIVTSTYGVGIQFNEVLMTQMAQAGGGLAFFAETAEELNSYFDAEFRLLESTVARHLEVQIQASCQGQSVPVSWKNARSLGDQGARLGDLAAESLAWGLAELALPEVGIGQTIEVSATFRYRDRQGQPHEDVIHTSVPVAAQDGEADGMVAARVDEVEAARLQREAQEAAARGNWAHTDALVNQIQGLAAASGNAYIGGVAANLASVSAARDQQTFGKEAFYASYSMTTRMVDLNEDVTTLKSDRFGLRKARQGVASPQ